MRELQTQLLALAYFSRMMAEGGLSTEDVLSSISSENNEEISNEQVVFHCWIL